MVSDTKDFLGSGEEKYKFLFSNLMSAFALHRIITDFSGKPIDYAFLEVNSSFEKMTGLKRDDIIGKKVSVVIPGTDTDPADWVGNYGKVALDGKAVVFENYSASLKKWFNISAYSPKKGYFVTIFEDITERKLTEETLRLKTRLLEAQTNATPDGILIVDENNKRVLTNQRIIELFDVPADIVTDEDDSKLLKYVVSLTRYPDQFLEKVLYLYSHPSETSRDEVEFKSGMILDRYSAPVLGKDGKNYGRIWIFRDITERKKAEEESQASKNALQSKLNELEKFNKITIDRELKMLELKSRIKELEKRLAEAGLL